MGPVACDALERSGLGMIWDRRSLVQAKISRRTHELADDTIQLGATRHA
jgi:hypothetical protein